ncbi:nucleoside phosphorylase [Adhaeribacter pallidiroseus]|uniref:Uridine phosphorylase n=1 Tax=Adhaeribacter pallidiroseus TaxID=2072847 RepID=A0A369QIA9_9BACT|nr:nucleoside phosphorylase [Adhaeribacter pallidiroseus]RDC64454.1 Uridine phosphorylase [Adhaeribacter pallidiroseus]
MPIAESELMLNPDGSVYHLNLLPEHISDTILTVGDPERVPLISKYFDSVEVQIAKREFVTHTGYYKGKRLTVLSTGMGTDNVEIVMNELDALVNIDLVSREINEDHIALNIIRLGTSGALQESIPLGSLLVSEYAVGLDTLMQFYPLVQTGYENTISSALQQTLQLSFQPYCVRGSDILREQLARDYIAGNTLTCPGFYAPQGRVLRLDLKDAELINNFTNFNVEDFWLTNFEMETAGYFALGRMLGHEVTSLNAIIVNRITKQFDQNADQTIEKMITQTLDRIAAIAKA